MRFRDLFFLNWKTFIIDLITFIIGIFLIISFTRLCMAEVGVPCPQSALSYIGFTLTAISIIHFIINLIIFIYKKLK